VGILDRLTEGVRSALDPRAPPSAPGASLHERLNLRGWSDDQLRAELERRRRARGRPANGRNAADDELTAVSQARRDRMREITLAKCYARLELPVGASRLEVQRAWRSMLRQYHPDRYLGDPEQHASSVAVVTGVTDAYLTILARFDRR
jgi:hypothetical protein